MKEQTIQNPIEVKTMQRCRNFDINGMLFYVFYLAKFEGEQMGITFDSKFERDFISKCFFCGCSRIQSGTRISNYIIHKSSFVDFYHKVKERFPEEKDSYIEEILINTFLAFRIGLHKNKKKNEQVLIYDEKTKKIVPLKGESTQIKKPSKIDRIAARLFLIPFFGLSDQDISHQTKTPDNLPELYKALKLYLNINGNNLLLYYTLYENLAPSIPEDIKKQFRFCKKEYHTKDGCVSKSFARVMQKKTKDERLNEFYQFYGLM